MGTWDVGPFDSDAGADFRDSARSADGVRVALRGDDEEAHAAAGVVAWALGRRAADVHPLHGQRAEIARLASVAAETCRRLRHRSELRDLWAETDLWDAWVAGIEDLERDLGGDPGASPTPPRHGGEDEEDDELDLSAPRPTVELSPPLQALYDHAAADLDRHLTLPVELRDPGVRIRHLPAELLALGAFREEDGVLVVERAPHGDVRLARWSWRSGAVDLGPVDSAVRALVPGLAVPDHALRPPEPGVTRHEASDGGGLWAPDGPLVEAWREARGRWWEALRAHRVAEIERAEASLALVYDALGDGAAARHHALGGRLLQRALADGSAEGVRAAGRIFAGGIPDEVARAAADHGGGPLAEVLAEVGLIDVVAVRRRAVERGRFDTVVALATVPPALDEAGLESTLRSTIPVGQILVLLERLADTLPPTVLQRHASGLLNRRMHQLTVDQIRTLLQLGGRPSDFGRRKASRRKDAAAVVGLLDGQPVRSTP